MSQALIEALQNVALYDHPVTEFDVVETHISWVILTGEFAYKIKKPNDFGFLDFSTLEKRQHFCNEELRLNQRLAPGIYLDLVAIYGDDTSPSFHSDGPAIEYAVRMRQFDQDYLLDRVLNRNQLSPQHIHSIAKEVAAFHQRTEAADSASDFGSAEDVMVPVTQNFEQIMPFLTEQDDIALLEQIERWATDTYALLQEAFAERKQQGFIKECHGDLHLGNITLIDETITLFDCIEFNDAFRIIDTMSEIAFFAMDLESRELVEFANLFVNHYLELSGDYQGLKLLNFYKSYRALVRAKVALFRLYDAPNEDRPSILSEYRRYAELAKGYMKTPHRFMIMMHGYSGTGKTSVSDLLVEQLGTVRLRSDVLRKQLFTAEGIDAGANNALYSDEMSDRTFESMAQHAKSILVAGYPAIVDGTFLKRSYRQLLASVAENQAVAMHIIDCELADNEVRKRLNARAEIGEDASDADTKVYDMQLESAEPLDEEELGYTFTLNTANIEDVKLFVERFASNIS